jgi:DNA-binding GntR family transcriptional regulator
VALEYLRRAISSRELKPGDQVYQEDLADRLGVSLIPVREALAVLEGEGQLTRRQNRGYFVTRLDFSEIEDAYSVRRLLETEAARDALPKVRSTDIAEMKKALKRVSAEGRSGNIRSALQANREFHFLLFERSRRPFLLRQLKSIWDATESYRALYLNDPAARARIGDEHDQIVAAVQAGRIQDLIKLQDAHRDHALEAIRLVLCAQGDEIRDKKRVTGSKTSAGVRGRDSGADAGPVIA